ncbi:MAG: M61 family metallopeptidase [Burkholderiales bacterium]|nr:M61 family metallopeptidase [Burkholderiales bacterium]
MSPPPLSPTRYRIAPLDPHAHLFEVSVTIDGPDPAGQRFLLPTWIPGSYLIREFARHFVSVRAQDARGTPVRLDKTAKNAWRADPCEGSLTVIAQVYAFDLSVRTAYLDETRGYFNGPAVFLLPEGRADAPCEVDIAPPASPTPQPWRVATTMPRATAQEHGFGGYRAANYDELIDHPVETSAFAWADFEAGGVPHGIAITGRHDADLARLTRDLCRVCRWQIDLFGEAPFDRYLFQVTAVGDGYGGLEHRASTSLLCRRDELPHAGNAEIDDDYLSFLGLASHEYFHAWNVKRIKPAAFLPYDLTREAYTRQLWAFEGITSYYDDLALVRCGLIDPARYLELLGRTLTTVLRAPGRHAQSIADSSFDAWIKYYRQDENSPNSVVSYYAKGSLVGCALDLLLRREGRSLLGRTSPEARSAEGSPVSLDDLMRALWQRYGRQGVGVPEDGIPALASELAGRDLTDFFARFVEGTEDPPLAELLADFGITFHLRPAAGASDRGGKPASGTAPKSAFGFRLGTEQRLAAVYRDGPAARAGLSANDILVAVAGLKATPERVASVLARYAPGERVEVHAFRRDELMTFTVTLGTAPADTCYLTLDPTPSPEALQRRNAWLGITASPSG